MDPALLTDSILDDTIRQDTVEYVLGELCANTADNDVRDVLRRYQPSLTTKQLTSRLGAHLKDTLEKVAVYLNCDSKGKKDEIVLNIIVRIQNLLPDTCQICHETFRFKIAEDPLIACDICGQEVHKPCFLKLLGLTSQNGPVNINPLKIPGLHYLCKPCEDEVIPKDQIPKWYEPPESCTICDQNCPHKQKQTPNSNSWELSCITGANNNADRNVASSASTSNQQIDEPLITSTQLPTGAIPHNSLDDQSVAPIAMEPVITPNETEIQIVQQAVDESNTLSNAVSETINISDVHEPNAEASNSSSGITLGEKTTTINKKSKRVCNFYKKNICKHGQKGKNCSFQHPVPCQKLILHGIDKNKGCKLGKKCPEFHPKMCFNSIQKSKCVDTECTLMHIRGTWKKPAKSPKNDAQQSHHAVDEQTTSNKTESSDSFLEMVRLLEVKLMEAMDLKIATLLSQLPQLLTVPQQIASKTHQPFVIPQHQPPPVPLQFAQPNPYQPAQQQIPSLFPPPLWPRVPLNQ